MTLANDIVVVSGALTNAYDVYTNPGSSYGDFVSAAGGVISAFGSMATNNPGFLSALTAVGKVGVAV